MADTGTCQTHLSPTIIEKFFSQATRANSKALKKLTTIEVREIYKSLPPVLQFPNGVTLKKPTEEFDLKSFSKYFREYINEYK